MQQFLGLCRTKIKFRFHKRQSKHRHGGKRFLLWFSIGAILSYPISVACVFVQVHPLGPILVGQASTGLDIETSSGRRIEYLGNDPSWYTATIGGFSNIDSTKHYWIEHRPYGWPTRSVYSELLFEGNRRFTIGNSDVKCVGVLGGILAQPEAYSSLVWLMEFETKSNYLWLSEHAPQPEVILPFAVYWPNQILNSLLYGCFALVLPLSCRMNRQLRLRLGKCPDCGYCLTGLSEFSGCPECGWNRTSSKGNDINGVEFPDN